MRSRARTEDEARKGTGGRADGTHVSVRLARHLRVDESVAEEHLQVVQSLPYGQRPRGRRRHRAFLSRPPARNRLTTCEARLGRTRTRFGRSVSKTNLASVPENSVTLALSAMNSRVPGLSWQTRVKSTGMCCCAKRGHFRGGNFEPISVFRASQSRARVGFLKRSSQRALFRFAFCLVREPPIFPYRNLPRLSQSSLAPLAKRRRRTSKQLELFFSRRLDDAPHFRLCCFSYIAPKKRRRSAAAPHCEARRRPTRRPRSDRPVLGLGRILPSPRPRSVIRPSHAACHSESGVGKICPERHDIAREQFLRRARIGSRGSRRAQSSQSAKRGVICSSRITHGPIRPRRTSFDSVSFGRPRRTRALPAFVSFHRG